MVELSDVARKVFEEERYYNPNAPSFSELSKLGKPEIPFNQVREKGEPYAVRLKYGNEEFDRVRQQLISAAKMLYGLNGKDRTHIEEIASMPFCTTNPIRVKVTINQSSKRTFYIKNSVPQRYYGKALYNILVPGKDINFRFSENGLIVDAVPGIVEAEHTADQRRALMNNSTYVDNLARMNVFTNLIFLDDIAENEGNLSVDDAKSIYLLDFDQAFRDGNYNLLEKLPPEKKQMLRSLIDIMRQERARIKEHALRNRQRLNALLDALSTEKDFDDFAWQRGSLDLGDLLKREFRKEGIDL